LKENEKNLAHPSDIPGRVLREGIVGFDRLTAPELLKGETLAQQGIPLDKPAGFCYIQT
jgi:hypothetical protein